MRSAPAAALSLVAAAALGGAVLTAQSVKAPQEVEPPGCHGAERWLVKVLKDPDAAKIDTRPVLTTVAALRALPKPASLPEASRIAPVELTTYTVTATIIGYKLEPGDCDYHVVLGDASGTMIVEFPSPTECPQGAEARRAFEARFHPHAGKLRRPAVPTMATFTGPAFYDRLHSQDGVAPSGIEIHPVLRVAF